MSRRPIDLHHGGRLQQPSRRRCVECGWKGDPPVWTDRGLLCLGCLTRLRLGGAVVVRIR